MIQHNYQSRYLVIIDVVVNVYKYETCKFDKPFLTFQTNHVFIGKTQDIDDFDDGNTILLECENIDYIYISGFEIVKFKIEDKIIDYISLIGNNMVSFPIAVGEKFIFFLYNSWKFFETNKIEKDSLLNRTKNSLDPFDYHVERCSINSFKKIEYSIIHTYYPNREDDDDDDNDDDDIVIETPEYHNGDNEVVKIFNEKCVICLEQDSIYAFRLCGHQFICQQCNDNECNIIILKCIVCRR